AIIGDVAHGAARQYWWMRPASRSRRCTRPPSDLGVSRGLSRAELERAMRPLGVVVLDVDAEHPLELTAVEDQQPVETFRASRLDEPIALAFGARTGVFTTRMVSPRKTSSEGGREPQR